MLNLGNHIDHYISEYSRLIVEEKKPSSKDTAFYDFIKEVKKSKFLILEFLLYRNIKNKTIKSNDSLLEEYIKDNLKKFNTYSLSDMISAHKLIEPFVINDLKDNSINNKIHTLLKESLTDLRKRNLHDFNLALWDVMQYLKEDKEVKKINLLESDEFSSKFETQYIIDKANDIFNQKYSSLNENERVWLKIFDQTISKNIKNDILDKFKENAKSFLNENKENNEDLIEEAIKKVDSINLESDDFEENFFEIHELIS